MHRRRTGRCLCGTDRRRTRQTLYHSGTQQTAGTQASHHRQRSLQSHQQLRPRHPDGKYPCQRKIPVQCVFPLHPAGRHGLFRKAGRSAENRTGQSGISRQRPCGGHRTGSAKGSAAGGNPRGARRRDRTAAGKRQMYRCPHRRRQRISGRTTLLATGGMSYPKTGSDGSGYRLAETAGHTIVPPMPSLIPLITQETWCQEAMGSPCGT